MISGVSKNTNKEFFATDSIDILEQDINNFDPKLLKILLTDHTTGKNIVWASDEYLKYGPDYAPECEILPRLIIRNYTKIIRPRVAKNREEQHDRTRKLAEVFTPSWICNEMNNHCDTEWFGCNGIFNCHLDKKWCVNCNKIAFPDSKNQTWQHYIDLRHLEITCGEAPYLVSRYDTTTGDILPIGQRIGIIDRKLRVVGENTSTEAEWFKWAVRAYESTYGYEYQGDNLLLARENMLGTFVDYFADKFSKFPSKEQLRKVAMIISWNIWQMNGFTNCPPLYMPIIPNAQLSLFGADDVGQLPIVSLCQIKNWRKKQTITFHKITEGQDMKFDYCVGNPPYQEQVAKKETNNGQKRSRSIFQYFQLAADQITKDLSVLIYPATRWIHRSGKGMQQFGYDQINDKRLKKLIVYQNAKEVFPSTEIGDGISIVIKKTGKQNDAFEYIYKYEKGDLETSLHSPGEDLIPLNPNDVSITKKLKNFVEANNFDYLFNSILPQKLFGIESDFVAKNPTKVEPLSNSLQKDFSNTVKLFTNDKAGKAGRATWFVTDRKFIPLNANLIDEWQVVVSSASPAGQKRDWQIEIIDNHSAFGRSRVALKSFQTEKEANNFYKYAKTSIVRYAFLLTDENLTSVGKMVPDILDYTNNSIIDFDNDIDNQLCSLIGLSNDEFAYIVDRVKSIRS